jgi:hypothetical protein
MCTFQNWLIPPPKDSEFAGLPPHHRELQTPIACPSLEHIAPRMRQKNLPSIYLHGTLNTDVYIHSRCAGKSTLTPSSLCLLFGTRRTKGCPVDRRAFLLIKDRHAHVASEIVLSEVWLLTPDFFLGDTTLFLPLIRRCSGSPVAIPVDVETYQP